MTRYLLATLDWINAHLFRNKIRWPLWLLDWAWDKQATPGPDAAASERQHTIDGPHYDTVGHNPSLCWWEVPHCGPCWIRGEPKPANPWAPRSEAEPETTTPTAGGD